MKLNKLRTFAAVVLSFAAGSLITARFMHIREAEAQSKRVFELRVYHTLPGRLPALEARFKNDTVRIFKKHNMTSVGYWQPEDAPASENTLIYILAHASRDAATKNWAAFRDDPEWQKVSKASEADGKIVDKVDSTFMDPLDFSAIK